MCVAMYAIKLRHHFHNDFKYLVTLFVIASVVIACQSTWMLANKSCGAVGQIN